jgi:hypothetical protein
LFEHAIRRMANRIADVRELSQNELMQLVGEDIEFRDLPSETKLDFSDDGPWRFSVACPKCSHITKARGTFLGQKVRCPKCQHEFRTEWGEPVAVNS